MRKKITVIGAGHVGEVTAFKIAEKELGDVKNLGILKERLAKGEISKKEYDELKKEFE